MFDGYAALRRARGDVHFDESVQAPAFLTIGGRVSGAGMAFAAGLTAVTLNGLGVIVAMKTPMLYRSLRSAAGAVRVHP